MSMASLVLAVPLGDRARLTAEQRSLFAGLAGLMESPERRHAAWMEAAWIDGDRSSLGARVAADPEAGLWLVFKGRIDNRRELLSGGSSPGNDAELALALYKRFGVAAFERILGPYACAVVEQRTRRVVMARDRSAGRWLCFHRRDDVLWIADRPAVLRGVTRNPSLDDETVRRFFQLQEPVPGATFFADVHEAPPGTVLVMDRDGETRETFPPLKVSDGVEDGRGWSDAAWEARFLSHLDAAVGRRMGLDHGPGESPAVLMSGGLDSTAIAALTAGRLEKPLTTVSWIFQATPEADERPYIDSVNRHLSSRPLAVDGDSAVPEPEMLRPSPDGPFEGPYRLLRRRTYERLASSRRVLFTGEMGDELLATGDRWLGSLLRRGRGGEALGEIGSVIRRCRGLRGTGLRGALRQCLRPAPAGKPDTLSPFSTWPCHLEAVEAAGYGLEIRRPFLDAALRAFVHSMPAHLIHRPGRPKRILRRALRNRLPAEVLQRSWSSTLLPLPRRFIQRHGPELWNSLLKTPQSRVFDHVDPAQLESLLRGRALCVERDGPLWVVVWRSLIFELWYRRNIDSMGSAADAPSTRLQVASAVA